MRPNGSAFGNNFVQVTMGALNDLSGKGFLGVNLLAALGTGKGDFLLGPLFRDQVGFECMVGQIQGFPAKGAFARPMGNFLGATGAGRIGSGT